MGDDKHTEVIEKHVSGDGKSTAALVTSIAAAVTAAVPAVKTIAESLGVGRNYNNGGNCGNGGNGLANAMVAAIPAIASAVAPKPVYYGGGDNCGCHGGDAILRARIAQLEAEKYSSSAATAESNRLIDAYIRPYGQEIADSRVREAKLQSEVDCLKQTQELRFQILEKDVQLAKQEAACCCAQNATAIANVASILGSVSKTVISNDNVCPGWGNVTITPSTATA